MVISFMPETMGQNFRVPGREPDEPVGGGAADCGAGSDPGLFQLGSDVSTDALAESAAKCRVTGVADRGEQLLRVGRAMAITLFGPRLGAALATLAGVEVRVMLSACIVCNRTLGGE